MANMATAIPTKPAKPQPIMPREVPAASPPTFASYLTSTSHGPLVVVITSGTHGGTKIVVVVVGAHGFATVVVVVMSAFFACTIVPAGWLFITGISKSIVRRL